MQAQKVFGYTRLMVASFGLGGGWSPLDRTILYSTTRIQAWRSRWATLPPRRAIHAHGGYDYARGYQVEKI